MPIQDDLPESKSGGTAPMQVGKIVQLTKNLTPLEQFAAETNKRIAMVNPEASFPPKELRDEQYRRGYEAGLRAQFQIDCEAECTACGKPEKYHPAVWVENDNTYQHEEIKTGKMEYCDATLLYMAYSDLHKDK